MISLMPLPYGADALEPHIGSETIETHHGKHHAGYVKKTNAAIADTPLADAALEAIIQHADDNKDHKLFNQAAQVWNHGFYWHSLSPKPGKPDEALSAAIERDHGSLEALLTNLSEMAIAHFGSGWVWLAMHDGAVVIEETHDASTMATGSAVPLLVIDVWEHAYYLDRRNLRDAYVKSVTEKLLNWDFANNNFANGTVWAYPS
jgi:superoxide dismutase, Fe-Mn family